MQSRKLSLLGWKTSDQEEIERRRLRASLEPMQIDPLEPDQAFFGTFRARSQSGGGSYLVEIRSLKGLQNSCTCPDYLVNGLGTCKHIEAVLARLRRGRVRLFNRAASDGSPRIEIYLSTEEDSGRKIVRTAWSDQATKSARALLDPYFSEDGRLLAAPEIGIAAVRRALESASSDVRRQVRISAEVEQWLDRRRRNHERETAREAFLSDLRGGKRSLDFLKLPLYPYQQEGALHLTFTERAMLADDMGLGKTVQAVAACELLRRLRRIERVLVVSPVSLKAEWEEQIVKFTSLPSLAIWGSRAQRLSSYRQQSFFYLTNYEQILRDVDEINRDLAPDVIILDEAQRIKNWQTKTAKAVKRLSSPFAFVLTGTPLENRIDEIYSILEFLDPQLLGPLFRFNREYYSLDERGKPAGYRNLDKLRRQIRPLMLRRRKEEVEEELPRRVVNNYFVSMHPEQDTRYQEYSARVARLVARARRRPLTKEESERLQKYLACMRMLCDTPYILDADCRVCPKLDELESILEEALEADGAKIIIFSEWERMLSLVAEMASERGIEYAWHTGSVEQPKRREAIRRFKNSDRCRLFLSTDAGSTGLNLQAARVVINLDLPWNPARLEQRIARAWRKHQKHCVQVINLVCEDSIEHRMLGLLSEKQRLADGVLDGLDNLESMAMPSGRAALMQRLEELMNLDLRQTYVQPASPQEPEAASPADPLEAFSNDVAARLPDRLLMVEVQSTELGIASILAVVDGPAEQCESILRKSLKESFPPDSARPSLDIVDRGTFETIQRLIGTGHLRPVTETARRLYENPDFEAKPPARPSRHTEAQKIFDPARRKLEMSELLWENGFTSEALPSLLGVVDTSLRALAFLRDVAMTDELGPFESPVLSSLLESLGVGEAEISAISRLNELGQDQEQESAQESQHLMATTRLVFDLVQERLHQAALR
ncbi:MAG: DEAD/DEAH box helicase [Acidobacteriota bacterium]